MGALMSAPKYDPARDIPDLTGKVALVTGGNRGIGYNTVAELVKKGAKVYLGARDESRATGAIAMLKAEGYLNDRGSGEVVWLKLDLSSVASSKAAAEELMRRETRLDILINNACLGPGAESFKLIDADIPICALMATNHLGHFVLTTALLPLLVKTAAMPHSDVRVIWVSSWQHTQAHKISWKSADDWKFKSEGMWSNMQSYGTTKVANVLTSKELQRRWDEQGIPALSISLHPGAIATEGSAANLKDFWLIGPLLFNLMSWFGSSPSQGAYTTLFAATSAVVAADKRKYAGVYLMPYDVITQASPEATDPLAARDLWETSERVVAALTKS